MYIIIAILIFSGLILIHEFGHYITARMFGVKVNEFAIGMGPRILHYTSKKTGTVYAIRLFLFGGFVSMEGEDSVSDEEGSFSKKPAWQKIIITGAGAFNNILLGFILMFAMVLTSTIGSTVIADFSENAVTEEQGLCVGDRITYVDGVRVHTSVELAYEVMRRGIEPIDIVVERDGETITLTDMEFPTSTSDGVLYGDTDFYVAAAQKNLPNVLKATWYQSLSSIKMIWESLFDLISGRYGVEAVSGPVGVTEAIGTAAKTSNTSLLYLCTLLAMNLGVFNLIPFPALDGGRILLYIIEAIRRKPLKTEIEAYINLAGLAVLMILMVAITLKDVIGLF